MDYVRVENGVVTERRLPNTGYIKGQAISNYDKLDPKALKGEGWLPIVEVKPIYDSTIQKLIGPIEVITKDKVTQTYTVDLLPEPEPPQPSEIDLIKERISILESKIIVKIL